MKENEIIFVMKDNSKHSVYCGLISKNELIKHILDWGLQIENTFYKSNSIKQIILED